MSDSNLHVPFEGLFSAFKDAPGLSDFMEKARQLDAADPVRCKLNTFWGRNSEKPIPLENIALLLGKSHRTLQRWIARKQRPIPNAVLTKRRSGHWRVLPTREVYDWLYSELCEVMETDDEGESSEFSDTFRMIEFIESQSEPHYRRRRVTVSAICKRLGISRATFYRRPGAKAALRQYWQEREEGRKRFVRR
jgi:predicted DNA-binding transcriptional regulator AlpA